MKKQNKNGKVVVEQYIAASESWAQVYRTDVKEKAERYIAKKINEEWPDNKVYYRIVTP